ncbi:hypothetical protein [Tumebacillus permanentifrigoris]|uniref:Uncharacterized protein n=1 Tax=Tumebacillus permanentifrigoris TaxID=378543 RepID=A0A316D531_9BACL|nr:hypothetical protein [Tumebacillus permanentifrigoris]PWK07427.1 hypothetical protein C7459_11725 [Tumebacillus permanentifrigoris]
MNRSKRNAFLAVLAMSLTATTLVGCNTGEKPEASAEPGKGSGAKALTRTGQTFDTAGNMMAYAEFELSGEPMAERLGLNLDLLDPQKVNDPTPFDYTAGIKSYEYSEEAMYEVVEKSGLGLHLINGPINLTRGANGAESLAKRFQELADATGYNQDEIFQNMYPTMIEYASGDPQYPQKLDLKKFGDAKDGVYTPMIQVDFASTRWNRDKMEKALIPSAYGGVFLKQALWLGDFLGNMHSTEADEETEPTSADADKDGKLRLGVSSTDGFQGMLLTEEVWNKLAYIRDNLFYDASTGKLTPAVGSQYNPSKGFVYLPHKIEVTEEGSNGLYKAGSLKVTDARSLLSDQWSLLWPASEFYGTTDQRPSNPNLNPAFQGVFDGAPFASAPAANLDDKTDNDVKATDPYSVNRDILLNVFSNLKAMHWNADKGSLVSENDGKAQGNTVDPFNVGYTMESLRIFQRAIDGLPVGYASGESAKGLGTEEGKAALDMIKRQGDFLITNLIDSKDGLVANSYDLQAGKADSGVKTLQAQLGAIRGLTAAFLATEDSKYQQAARDLYLATDKAFYDKTNKLYKTKADGSEYKYTPWIAGGLSAMFRMGTDHLKNDQPQTGAAEVLNLKNLTERYTEFYDNVIDGIDLGHGMQASEMWDTGDVYKEGDDSGNSDQDHIYQLQKAGGPNGTAPILLDAELK